MRISIEYEIEEDALIDTMCANLGHEELKEFVTKIDLRIADVEFTENIIKKLVNSMAQEYSKCEEVNDKKRMKHWTSILNTIEDIKKIPE